MKTPTTQSNEETTKLGTTPTQQTKSTKKSSKSRAKSTKIENLQTGNSNKNATGNISITSGGQLMQQQQGGSTTNQVNLITTPTTPTSALSTGVGGGVGVNMFETSFAQLGGGSGSAGGGIGVSNVIGGTGSVGIGGGGNGLVGVAGGSINDINTTARSHHKSYAGLEPRSIKIIWEQHDQSDIELSNEVCSKVAEDASYKLWELINNIKTFSRHSGATITYDLVNEVLRDCDVPPCLGAMDSDWDRIDYDGSYFFYSDKILELREEYQKDVSFTVPHGPDFKSFWPLEDKHMENIKKYVPSLIYVAINGTEDDLDSVLAECAFSSTIGSCYRLILTKLIQIIAFKQTNDISLRCWRLLRALTTNPQTRDADCREEYFHLSEILICQLLAPYESIKIQNNNHMKGEESTDVQTIKIEMDGGMKMENNFIDNNTTAEPSTTSNLEQSIDVEVAAENCEHIFKLQSDCDEDVTTMADGSLTSLNTSPYFATPVDWKLVDDLCQTIGMLGALNGYFQSECLYHIIRRLKRFFNGRCIRTERDYYYISRSVRGLVALGEHAFREFIPFLYELKIDEVPETIWNDFTISAVFLQGSDDIFLYEWLEYVCGGDKLQPFMLHYAQYYEKFLLYRYRKRKQSTFKLYPKLSVRRLEWNALAAAMCHGDDPNNAIKPKPCIKDLFPDLKPINMNLNRAGNIRFKFAGCRPVILKPKDKFDINAGNSPAQNANGRVAGDVLIAKRRLFKPLTNESSMIPLSSYYFLRI